MVKRRIALRLDEEILKRIDEEAEKLSLIIGYKNRTKTIEKLLEKAFEK